ncbi:trypsin domain-containing protein [Phthorimaea operculella]|nr:trypsin domain-containing protein [Phthorimaea operculella]
MWVAIVFLISLTSALAGPAPKNGLRVIGGTETTIELYPYAAVMIFEFFPDVFMQNCGGAILNEKSILSAAHCYSEKPSANNWRVRVGSSFASSGGQVHTVERLINHPQYNAATFDHDIAVVHLATFIAFNSVVQQAVIAGPNYVLNNNDPVWGIGWGSTGMGTSEQLKHVQQRVVSNQACQSSYPTISITATMLCVSTNVNNQGLCVGDSGGPNIHGNTVVGVTAFTPYPCAQGGLATGLARVSSYIDWLCVVPHTKHKLIVFKSRFFFLLLPVDNLDLCVGDSGGPNIHGNTVVGVTAFTPYPCAQGGLATGLARVSSYIDWILDNVGLCVGDSDGPNIHGNTVVGVTAFTPYPCAQGGLATGLARVSSYIDWILDNGLCVGDSGGPNIHGNTVVGVTAFTPYPCAQGGLATGLARVSSYIDWILDNVGLCVGDSGGPNIHGNTVVGVTAFTPYPCAQGGLATGLARVSSYIDWILDNGLCVGDSGGPNIHGNTVVGVTAFTPYPCAQGGLATGLARVSSYIDWILENVGLCVGDSGGPNIHGNTVVGVTAFTPYPCAQGGLATGLARVSSYIDWILDNVVTG